MKIIVSFKKRTISVYDDSGYYNGGSTLPLNTSRKVFKNLVNSYTLEYKGTTVVYGKAYKNYVKTVSL